MRRPATPVALAWAATLAGVISIVSALTPEFADRTDLIDGVLPPGVPEAARTVALALGLAMIFLSRGLARRKRRAWTLAVATRDRVGDRAPREGPRLRGGDRPHRPARRAPAFAPAVRRAGRPGDASCRSLQVAAALAVAVPILVVGIYDTDVYSRRIEVALALLVGALGFRALWLWLRPQGVPPAVGEERERAAELVQEHGTDSLAYFALRRDKSYFFSPSGRSFLAYRVIGGTALVAGDPIGDAAERRELVREFVRVAHAKGWRVAVAGAANEALEDYAAIGFKSMYLGDEAVIRPATFSLDGRAIRKVRQSVSRLEKSRLSRRGALDRRRRRAAARAGARGLRGVARQLAGARLHDGDGRALPLPGHRARSRRRARRPGRRLPAARARRRRARATRSRRCAAAATRRTG